MGLSFKMKKVSLGPLYREDGGIPSSRSLCRSDSHSRSLSLSYARSHGTLLSYRILHVMYKWYETGNLLPIGETKVEMVSDTSLCLFVFIVSDIFTGFVDICIISES